MSQTIEINLPNSSAARDEVLSYLVTKGLIRPDKYAALTSPVVAALAKKRDSFSAKWAGCFAVSTPDGDDPRYRALARKYL